MNLWRAEVDYRQFGIAAGRFTPKRGQSWGGTSDQEDRAVVIMMDRWFVSGRLPAQEGANNTSNYPENISSSGKHPPPWRDIDEKGFLLAHNTHP